MIEIFVKVTIGEKSYQTNVVAQKGTANEEIIKLAEEQVRRQWSL
ncbi:BA3454 family stress response protein [Peribacillus muralis]